MYWVQACILPNFFGANSFWQRKQPRPKRTVQHTKNQVLGQEGWNVCSGGDVDFKILDVNTEQNARKAMPNATPNHRSKSDETPLPWNPWKAKSAAVDVWSIYASLDQAVDDYTRLGVSRYQWFFFLMGGVRFKMRFMLEQRSWWMGDIDLVFLREWFLKECFFCRTLFNPFSVKYATLRFYPRVILVPEMNPCWQKKVGKLSNANWAIKKKARLEEAEFI